MNRSRCSKLRQTKPGYLIQYFLRVKCKSHLKWQSFLYVLGSTQMVPKFLSKIKWRKSLSLQLLTSFHALRVWKPNWLVKASHRVSILANYVYFEEKDFKVVWANYPTMFSCSASKHSHCTSLLKHTLITRQQNIWTKTNKNNRNHGLPNRLAGIHCMKFNSLLWKQLVIYKSVFFFVLLCYLI